MRAVYHALRATIADMAAGKVGAVGERRALGLEMIGEEPGMLGVWFRTVVVARETVIVARGMVGVLCAMAGVLRRLVGVLGRLAGVLDGFSIISWQTMAMAQVMIAMRRG